MNLFEDFGDDFDVLDDISNLKEGDKLYNKVMNKEVTIVNVREDIYTDSLYYDYIYEDPHYVGSVAVRKNGESREYFLQNFERVK